MTFFTKQEKLVLKFLGLSLVVGFLIGGIRHLPGFQTGTSLELQAEIATFDSLSAQSWDSATLESDGTARKTNESIPETAVKLVNINTADKAELMTIPAVAQ